MKLLAFHSDQNIKAKYLERLRAHVKADELIHGVGWYHGKGCAVGCTLENYRHAAYETELGIPELLAHLEDVIFEGLPSDAAQKFPLAFLRAIEPGADLALVIPKFLLASQKRILKKIKGTSQEVEKVIGQVIAALSDWIEAGNPDKKAAAAAAHMASAAAAHMASAVADDAEAAGTADAAVLRAITAVAKSAADAAVVATDNVLWDTATFTRWFSSAIADATHWAAVAVNADDIQKEYKWMADKLIQLLKEAIGSAPANAESEQPEPIL